MKAGLGLAAGAVVVATLAGCGSGGAPLTAASLRAKPSATATLTWVQRDCLAATAAMNDVAGPLERQDAAGVVAAGRLARTEESVVGESEVGSGSTITEYPYVVESADAVLGEIVIIANDAAANEDYGMSWSAVTEGGVALASTFRSLEAYCSAAGVTIGGSQPAVRPAPSTAPNPYSVGCPTSAQLLTTWNAALPAVRDTWVALPVTGFSNTVCWRQWVASNPITNANGWVIFTRTGRQLAVLPETELSEFNDAICGVPSVAKDWTGPGAPAFCPQSG
jgi:hypothetical protein